MSPPHNSKIITYLHALKDLETSFFKIRAYKNAIDNLSKIHHPIYSVEDVENVNGIGKSIKSKVKEIIETGKLASYGIDLNSPFERQKKENEKVRNKLIQIHGIGPKKAKALYESGIIFENLGEHLDVLSHAQKIGFLLFDDLQHRIPFKEMRLHDKIIQQSCKEVTAEITGSYRRKCKTSGDIDVLITTTDLKAFQSAVDNMIETKYITHILAQGSKKLIGVCKLKDLPHRRIDIIYTHPNRFPYALLYFTGSGEFNVKMRNIALQKKYSLSEYGLKRLNKNEDEDVDEERQIANIKSEKDIFHFLGISYLQPKDRYPENIAFSEK